MKEKIDPSGKELFIGAHQSIAGGIFKAFDRAEQAGCSVLQVFTKNSNRWKTAPLTAEDIANYKTAASKSSIHYVIVHDSYLINLCAVDPIILQKSREAFVDELRRCESLGIRFLNFHPGAHVGAGEEAGIRGIIESLNWAHERTPECSVLSVLETTAGQGTVLGYRFEQLREIIDGVDDPDRMAVCIDTCHIFAAGYEIHSASGYSETMKKFEKIIGFDRLVAMHFNDSKKPLGSKVDRHEHIGNGYIGQEGFRLLMQDGRLKKNPKILETPKSEDLHEDIANLKLLRFLAQN